MTAGRAAGGAGPMAAAQSGSRRIRWRPTVLMMIKQRNDQDVHKGAIEGDRPTDEQIGNPHGEGVDEDGLPNDPVAVAEDALGAQEDESQG